MRVPVIRRRLIGEAPGRQRANRIRLVGYVVGLGLAGSGTCAATVPSKEGCILVRRANEEGSLGAENPHLSLDGGGSMVLSLTTAGQEEKRRRETERGLSRLANERNHVSAP